jgi:hypothetical protein
VRRGILLLLALSVAVMPATADARKKQRKPALQGPVSTVAAVGNVVNGFDDVSTAVANCPAGTAALGGGFSAPLDSVQALAVFNSYRSAGGSWTVDALRLAGSVAVTAFVYCRKANKPIADVAGTGTVPSSSSGSASATCPLGSHLISGGFQSDRAPAVVALPRQSMNIGPETWSVIDVNNSAAVGSRTITAHAYCISGIRKPTVPSAVTVPVLADGGAGSTTSPSCPPPKKPKKGKKRKVRPQLLSGGGFAGPPPGASPSLVFSESRIAGTGWRAGGVNESGTSGQVSITSQAICVG